MALKDRERKILYSIRVASENDPSKPEYPPDDPEFPATPTYKIKVPGFSNVWLKDESKNPTGTHKDRMAWEMVVSYKDFLTNLHTIVHTLQIQTSHCTLLFTNNMFFAIN